MIEPEPTERLPVVAIDGRSATGKSTLGGALARRLGFAFLDSGAVYRLAACELSAGNLMVEDLGPRFLSGALDVRGSLAYRRGVPVPEAELDDLALGSVVAVYASQPRVRDPLTDWIRARARALGPVVVVGRDIGTAVFPTAIVKFFLTADDHTRSGRRLGQDDRQTRALRAAMAERDRLDETRAVAPLFAARDALVIANDELPLSEVLERMETAVRDRFDG